MRAIAISVVAAALTTLQVSCVQTVLLAEHRDGGASPFDDSGLDDRQIANDRHDPNDATEAAVHLDGTLVAENTVSNAASASSYETRIVLHVARAGLTLQDATVTVTGAAAVTSLVYSGGAFVGSLHGYDATYALDVVVANVVLLHAVLVGPAYHVFTSPRDGDTSGAGVPLSVAWAPSGAQSATVETNRLAEMAIDDSGTWVVPSTALMGDSGQLDPDRVRIRRRNVVAVPGGSGDSSLVFEIRNEVAFAIDGRS